MDEQRQERIHFINQLSAVIENSTARANSLLQELGWTKERLMDDDTDLVKCPIDKTHLVKPDNLKEHVKVCQLRSVGINDLSAKDLPDSSSFFYESSSPSVAQVILDKNQITSLGLTMKRPGREERKRELAEKISIEDEHERENHKPVEDFILFQLPSNYLESLLSVEDRLRLYEHSSQRSTLMQIEKSLTYDELEQATVEQLKVLDMHNQEDADRPKSKVEAMAELRDYKRRRQSYRAKTITQSKRPATEVIRELIDQQMKYLEIISGKRIENDADDIGESEEKADLLTNAAEEPVRDVSSEGARENSKDEESRFGKEKHRYGIMKESHERRHRDMNDERRRGFDDRAEYRARSGGSRETRNRAVDREWNRSTDRDRNRDRYRERNTDRNRNKEKTADRDRNRDKSNDRWEERNRREDERQRYRRRYRERSTEIYRLDVADTGTKKDGGRNKGESEIRIRGAERDNDIRDAAKEEVHEEWLHREGRGASNDDKELRQKSSDSSWKNIEAEVEEKLGEIRMDKQKEIIIGTRDDADTEEHLEDECQESEYGKRRRRRRSRSSSGSATGSATGSRVGSRSESDEIYTERRSKHKKKKKRKKKRKKMKASINEDEDIWVEKR